MMLEIVKEAVINYHNKKQYYDGMQREVSQQIYRTLVKHLNSLCADAGLDETRSLKSQCR